jgi:murein DD-endopeptidase MepM/ murein hydrolase activator NlpD
VRVGWVVSGLGVVAGTVALLMVAALFMTVGGDSGEEGAGDAVLASAQVSRCTIAGSAAASGSATDALTDEQRTNATTIIGVGLGRRVPPYGLVIAIATALQESTLRNLDGGDRDSAGLFQQRPSTGWGTWEQVTDPVYSATAFFGGPDVPPGNPGLFDVPGWEQLPVTVAAQRVQRSAFPDAYARHEALAAAIVQELTGTAPPACTPLAAGPWSLPIAASAYRLTSPFGSRVHPVRRTPDFHTGLDFAAPTGTPVLAVSDGEVLSVGPGGGYGLLLKLRHANGVESWYAHLSTAEVAVGDRVGVGSAVATVGSTGNSTGPHLHLEVRVDGSPVDPRPWLAEQGVPP